jgi:hypothetical protein
MVMRFEVTKLSLSTTLLKQRGKLNRKKKRQLDLIDMAVAHYRDLMSDH